MAGGQDKPRCCLGGLAVSLCQTVGLARGKMSIFDDVDRAHDEGARHDEGHFEYLNRSGRPALAAVRAWIDDALLRYPDKDRNSLVGKIKSADEVAHRSGLFELLLHEALLKSGCVVEAIEPALPHTDKSPDFLVRAPNGERLYLEATLATGLSDADRRARKRLNAAIEAVNSVRSQDYVLDATFRGTPSQPIRLRRLRERIEGWLQMLDYDTVSETWQRQIGTPAPFRHEESDLAVELRAIPRPNRQAPPGRAIAIQGGDAWSRTIGSALRQAIEGKVNRYGELDLPFVVAVNGTDHNGEDHDVFAALLGQEVVRIPYGPEGLRQADAYWDRDGNGVWVRPDGVPRRQGLSGVLAFNELSVWSAPKRRGLYVPNPWARQSLDAFPLAVDQMEVHGDELRRNQGASFGAVLGLPDDWLENLD